ncbi:uncharacterized protein LOC128551667, partial [Mercenaria mercenaria]|uniref:uncharacterized protein LOC128551667 n=1 Tax=Mercenaria mercenaria TaxID=6596 RepID=UPI00234F4506
MPGTYRNQGIKIGPLLLCEVEIFSRDLIQEIKQSVQTSMSSKSTWNAPQTSWDKDRALDNIDAYNPDTCSCCSGTTGNDTPWWRINLGKKYLISDIWIYGRSDASHQSTNLYIYGTNRTNVNQNQYLFHGDPEEGSYIYSIKLPKPRLFQYLTIRRWVAGLMTLCEVVQLDITVTSAYDSVIVPTLRLVMSTLDIVRVVRPVGLVMLATQ